MRKYPFYPAYDGKHASPVTEWFVHACNRRWGFTNLGIYANRQMRSGKGLSVHATGWACDVGYGTTPEGRAKAVEAWNWLLANSKALGICEVHDYAYGKFGRGYRCSRGEGSDPKSVKVYTATENAGTPGGRWLHVELDPTWTLDAFQAAWKALPKP